MWPIDERFTDAPDVQLYARAMTPREWAHVRRNNAAGLLYALATDDGPVWNTLDEACSIRADEAKRIAKSVELGLAVCAPTYGRVDLGAWENVLREGAKRSGAIARAWGDACDTITGLTRVVLEPRPERYHGVPLAEVLDGHRMVQAVCRQLLDSR